MKLCLFESGTLFYGFFAIKIMYIKDTNRETVKIHCQIALNIKLSILHTGLQPGEIGLPFS